ncbi:MAG: penicillin acylase family protein [Candidatus Helarchaeota archaeon]|nr:penicillin acylase family protein [Candidatus Helarchaeota archaeon]
MKGKLIKEGCVAAGTVAFIIILTMSFGIIPALGNFLNPFGVWTVPGNAQYHDMTITDSQLSDTVTVQFDEYGIPHIHAQTDLDLLFVLGYLHAENRLFEMDMFRRAPAGRLSELTGDSMLEYDKYFRILGFNRAAQDATAYLQENETFFYNLLQSYANGVNKFIDSITPWTMPLEYKLLSVSPEPWTPLDSILVKYLQSWDLSGTMADLDTTLLREKLPASVYAELYPNYTLGMEPFQEPIIPYEELTILEEEGETSALVRTLEALKVLDNNRLRLFGSAEIGFGSNNWAVNGSKSTTNTSLLAGDPHLGYQQPSLWYEVHMISEEGYNCCGVGFPGTPVILIGHNEHVAWSLTNIGSDTFVDFYEEKLNGTHYLFNGTWEPLMIYNEVIKVKGDSDVTFTVRETIHGPLITDHDIVTNMAERGFETVNISLKWVGRNVDPDENYSNAIKAVYKWNKATNFSDFNDGLRYFDGMQNIVYADDLGTIAMTITGIYPIRKLNINGTIDKKLRSDVVQNGTGFGEEWDGFIPFNELPREVNPNRCWVSSCNQPSINGSYDYYIGENTFSQGYRARRINDLLESKPLLDIDDFKTFQLDNYAFSASQFLPILLDDWNNSIDGGQTYEPAVMDAMNELFSWNQSSQRYIFNKSLIAPTIFERWFRIFEQNTWDEFSAYDASGLRLPPNGILENLTKFQPDSIWFDDNSTTGPPEGRNYTMLKSLNETVAYLQATCGNDMSNWIWGNQRPIYLEHLTGISALSSPKIAIDGYGGALNAQGGGGGPSMRILVNLGNITMSDTSLYIYPGGQSGNPVSTHYLENLGWTICRENWNFSDLACGDFFFLLMLFSIRSIGIINNRILSKDSYYYYSI